MTERSLAQTGSRVISRENKLRGGVIISSQIFRWLGAGSGQETKVYSVINAIFYYRLRGTYFKNRKLQVFAL